MRRRPVLVPVFAVVPGSPALASAARTFAGVLHLGRRRVRWPSMPAVLCAVVLALSWTGCWFLPDAIARAGPTGLCPSADAKVLRILPH